MPIAIVGIACRLPGEATCTDKLWELLAKKEAAWSKMPADRMNIDSFYHPDGERGGNVCAQRKNPTLMHVLLTQFLVID